MRAKDWAFARLTAIKTAYGQPQAGAEFIAAHAAVLLYAQWERYAEERLTETLVSHPNNFLHSHGLTSMKKIPKNLALFLVRDGHDYFAFKSSNHLIEKGDKLIGKDQNPFRRLSTQLKTQLDTLAAVRNHIVHLSDSARRRYKKRVSRHARSDERRPLDRRLQHLN